jgi:hypothetical protein
LNTRDLPDDFNALRKITLLYVLVALFTIVSCQDDPCDGVACLNGGLCNEGNCLCAPGYEGSDCSTEQRAKFIATYNFNEICTGGEYNYVAELSASVGAVTQVRIANFAALTGTEIIGVVGGSDMNIPQQYFAFEGEQWGIVGTGHLGSAGLTIVYTLTFPNGSLDECTAFGIPQ